MPLLVLVFCIGCSAVPQIRYFELAVPASESAVETPAATPQAPAILHLGVDELEVDPPYDQDRLVYRRSAESTEVGFYEFTRWAAPLGQLLQRDLVRQLQRRGDVGQVEELQGLRTYHRVLRGRVLQAEEVDLPDGRVAARLRLELQLADSDGNLCWRGEVGGEVTGHAADGAQVMALLGRAAEQLLDEAGRQLSEQRAVPAEGQVARACQ